MKDQERIDSFRHLLGYWNEFDVFLTAPFRDQNNSTSLFEDRFPFYERIGDIVSDLGKSIFLPHRDLDTSQSRDLQQAQLYEIVIPSCKLEIAYFPPSPHFGSIEERRYFYVIDPNMLDWDLMWSNARTSRIPSISLYVAGMDNNPLLNTMPNQIDKVPFETEDEALKELERSVKQFFNKKL